MQLDSADSCDIAYTVNTMHGTLHLVDRSASCAKHEGGMTAYRGDTSDATAGPRTKKTVLALQEGDTESTMSVDNLINISLQDDSPESGQIRNIEVSLSNNLEVEIKEQMNVQKNQNQEKPKPSPAETNSPKLEDLPEERENIGNFKLENILRVKLKPPTLVYSKMKPETTEELKPEETTRTKENQNQRNIQTQNQEDKTKVRNIFEDMMKPKPNNIEYENLRKPVNPNNHTSQTSNPKPKPKTNPNQK